MNEGRVEVEREGEGWKVKGKEKGGESERKGGREGKVKGKGKGGEGERKGGR